VSDSWTAGKAGVIGSAVTHSLSASPATLILTARGIRSFGDGLISLVLPKEIAVAKSVVDASPSAEKTQFVPQIAGVHGSSTLREDQNPAGAEENWATVKQFLAKFSS
jgi:hypothetical protein